MFSVNRLVALLVIGKTLALAVPAKTPTCRAVCPTTDINGNALTESDHVSDIDLLFCQWGDESNYGYYMWKGPVRIGKQLIEELKKLIASHVGRRRVVLFGRGSVSTAAEPTGDGAGVVLLRGM